MKTIIKIRTYMCPLGVNKLGELDACRFHRAFDNLPEENQCPIHLLELVEVSNDLDKITVSILNEIEVERFVKYDDELIHTDEADNRDRTTTEYHQQRGLEFNLPIRLPVSETEKNILKDKIKSNIIKFQAMQ